MSERVDPCEGMAPDRNASQMESIEVLVERLSESIDPEKVLQECLQDNRLCDGGSLSDLVSTVAHVVAWELAEKLVEFRLPIPHDISGAKAIWAERVRQIDVEGYSASHDRAHGRITLVHAGFAYLWWARLIRRGGEVEPARIECLSFWPFEPASFKPKDDEDRNLAIGGAFIAAALDVERDDGDE